MRYSNFELAVVYGCLLWLFVACLTLGGCSGRTSYTVKATYVNSISDKEVRTIDVSLDQSSYWKNAILVDFPRTIKMINEEYIWRFKK